MDWGVCVCIYHLGSGPADLFATLAKSILNRLLLWCCCCMSMLNDRTVAERRLTRRSTKEGGSTASSREKLIRIRCKQTQAAGTMKIGILIGATRAPVSATVESNKIRLGATA